MKERILVLGAASWLGSLLIKRFSNDVSCCTIAGTFYKQKIHFNPYVTTFCANKFEDYEDIITQFKPTVIVNLLRGEDEVGIMIHKFAADYLNFNSGFYLYASSALALDGYRSISLTENLLANAKSQYGIYKANAEYYLYNLKSDWCILRFSSVQGWVSHKKTRNEIFLQKMFSNELVTVDRGVIQNRMLADKLVAGIYDIISRRITGILHFGSTDSSEEYYFLRRVAKAFGYPDCLVIEGNSRNVNLVTIPSKIFSLFGDNYKITEQNVIDSLLEIPELLSYFNPKRR